MVTLVKTFLSTMVMVLMCGYMAAAQNFSEEFSKVYSACLSLRSASVSGSTFLMKSAGTELKEARTRYFSTLQCLDKSKPSLNGHFIFDCEFVDSLIINRNVYSFAQRYANRSAERSISYSGGIYIKTCCVSASSSARYSFVSSGYQELAVIAEGGGLINLRVYDATNKVWHNDTQDLNIGRPSRTRAFEVPNTYARLEIEVINKTDKDISFVVISN